MTKVI
jgi:hypothetical protein